MLRILLPLALLPTFSHAQPICAIQGTGDQSPYEGQQVTTEGIVTARFTGTGSLNGYYIEHPGCDADAQTSNGIFVYAPNPGSLAVGQRVSVSGTVVEFNGLTEITNASHSVLGTSSVTPTDITLPIASSAHWERYEGMLLRFPGSLMVVDNGAWSQYGEVYLAPQRTRVPTDHIDPNDANASGTSYTGASNVAALTAAQNVIDRSYVLLDDARTVTWPTPTPYADAAGTLRAGSTVNDLTGVLHYSYGAYKLEPTGAVPFQYAPRPMVPSVGGGVRAAGFNVQNYFTTPDDWGASNAAELGRQRTKLVAALQAMDADVVALSEIENIDAAWEDLLAGLNAAMGAGTHAALEEDAFGRGTRMVILYKPGVMSPATPLYALNTGLFQRPHITQGFRLNASGGLFLFSTMHLRSKLCDGATGANEDQGDHQGCYNDMRRSQASALIDHWAGLRSATGIEAQLIVGDYNAYAQEDPLDRLRASGLVYQIMDDGHTHSYASMFGALDHVFATTAMDQAITGTAVWHINTDEPPTLDYRDGNLSRYQPNAFRSSDHDPVLVGFNGGDLSVGVDESVAPPPVTFMLAGTQAVWRSEQQVPGMVELFDVRGAVVRSMPIAGGLAQADLGGLPTGVYAWRVGAVVGRFLLR